MSVGTEAIPTNTLFRILFRLHSCFISRLERKWYINISHKIKIIVIGFYQKTPGKQAEGSCPRENNIYDHDGLSLFCQNRSLEDLALRPSPMGLMSLSTMLPPESLMRMRQETWRSIAASWPSFDQHNLLGRKSDPLACRWAVNMTTHWLLDQEVHDQPTHSVETNGHWHPSPWKGNST